MGISGLLQFLKEAAEPISIKKYEGQTVAVDTYCWLHKGAFSCADKLAKGEPTDQYVWYCMKFVEMLLNFSVKPILVFDGRNLPSKQEVEKTRRERREANLQRGRQLLREGRLSEARDCFGRCVNITPAMAHNLIKAARQRGVDCVVAPYEADAQLAYLSKAGFAQAVITEDSDLLAFGCQTVILKMDKHGNGMEIDQNNLGRCRSLGNVFTEEKFRYMCILAGCDYLPSLHGIGLGKACKLLRLAKDPDILKVIRKMGQYLKMNLVVPEEYIEGFIRANNTFLYQLVFDPAMRKVVPLNPYPEHVDAASLSYAGVNVGDDKGLDLALGNLDINTMERIDDFSPDKPHHQPCKARSNRWSTSPASAGGSIWSKSFPSAPAPPCPAGSPDQPPSTRGKQRVISLHHLRLQQSAPPGKRLRDDSCISDQEVLQQYSSPGLKRFRSEQQAVSSSSAFTTLLQRRNQETAGEDSTQSTHSRFFSRWNSASAAVSSRQSTGGPEPTVTGGLEQKVAGGPSQDSSSLRDSFGSDVPPVETPSPPVSPGSSPPTAASKGRKLFQWSGSAPSALVALQQFEYRRGSSLCLQTTGQLSEDSPPPERRSEEEEHLPDSPPSQDSAYFSQSQSTNSHREDVLPYSSSFSFQEETGSESSPGADSKAVTESSSSLTETCRKAGMLGSKVSGLSRLKSSAGHQAAKTAALGPARASGLRKKAGASGKKCCSPTNENNPGVQATISSLWKNFSYKKETQKISCSKKGEPMSAVKDNLLLPQHT